MSIDRTAGRMSVTLHTTEGDVKLELYCSEVPKLCFNFLGLAASGAYDGTKFHRNIKGFIVQGGGGKESKSIWGNEFEDIFHPNLKHDERGVVSMANKGPNTNAAQFFITYGPQPHLDNVYSVFGKVIDGMETLDVLENVPVGAKNRPVKDIVIERITIHSNPLAEEGIMF